MSTASVPIMIWFILLLSSVYHLREIEANECLDRRRNCGDMEIPFPFRIRGSKDACGLPGFEINCTSSGTGQPEHPFLNTLYGQVRIMNILENHILINSTRYIAQYTDYTIAEIWGIPSGGPFRISANNEFFLVGCNSLGVFRMGDIFNDTNILYGGCVSVCASKPNLSNCTGDGCCRTQVPSNYTQFYITAGSASSILNGSNTLIAGVEEAKQNNLNTYAAIVDADSISQSGIKNFNQKDISMRLDWAILNETCSLAEENRSTSLHCDPNADCQNRDWGIVCKCREGYKGDGYKNGTKCQDVDECSDPKQNVCKLEGGRCENTVGSYKCASSTNIPILPLTIGLSLVAVLVGGAALFWIHRRRKSWLVKHNNFRRNGGERLQSLISSWGEATRIFSLDEIKKATNKFSESLVLGTGGYDTVYKGTLLEGLEVAIKKSKSFEVDSKEIDQFINEVVILSQINHRNVVKVLGCCLETPIPLLVYEYISNGTLFEHLYEDKYQQSLEWEDRLHITPETAEALSYLHSAASIPIIHRDVKSSNILLDQGCTAKVADFGVSRLVPRDQTHLSTIVQGTMGYLDPEYFQTSQLTEKSDVYSFGVVLAELVTGLKPISYERSKNDSNLAIYFLSKMKTQDLADILDSRLNLEDSRNVESIERVAKLATECLSMEGEKRPTMKEVVQELLGNRRGSRVHAWSDRNAAENEDDSVALMVEEEERSDGVQICTAMGELSMTQSRAYSLGIEAFKDSLGGGR